MGTAKFQMPLYDNKDLEKFLDQRGMDGNDDTKFQIAFSWRFLLPSLDLGKTIKMGMNAENAPLVIISEESNKQMIVMPMHLG